MKTLTQIILVISILALAVPALAKPILNINLKAEKEVIEEVDGKEVRKIVQADEIFPGETIIYTLDVINSGDQPASNVKVTDPIPEGTVLIPGSAFGDDAKVSYSIDGGETYNHPSLLAYKVTRNDGTVENRVASYEQYTNIQWVLKIVPAGGSRSVGFRTLVK